MSEYCYAFTRTLLGNAVGGTTATIADTKPEPGYVFCYDRVAFENVTTLGATFRVGVNAAGNFTPLDETAALAKSTLSVKALAGKKLDGDNGDGLEVRVTGATPGDELHVYVSGYAEKKEGV